MPTQYAHLRTEIPTSARNENPDLVDDRLASLNRLAASGYALISTVTVQGDEVVTILDTLSRAEAWRDHLDE